MQVFASSDRGEWRKIDFSPPFSVLLGDTFRTSGNILEQIRGGVVIATRTLDGAISEPMVLGSAPGTNTLGTIYFFKEKRMPGQNVACTNVVENQTTGAVTFTFSSGNSQELANWVAAGEAADDVDASAELAEKILMAKAYRSSPDGANKTNQVGAQVSINCTADQPVVYTPPE